MAEADLQTLTGWCRRQPRPPRIELRCPESDGVPTRAAADGDAVQPVRLTGCLAEASLPALLELVTATGLLVLRLDACGAEPSDVASQLGDALGAVGAGGRLEVCSAPPEAAAAASPPGPAELDVAHLPPRRRGLVGWFLPPHEGESAVAEPAPGPGRRELVALRAVAAGELDPSVPAPALDLRADGCTACGTCVKVCPVDVLALDTDGDSASLNFTAAGCTGCGACLQICPADALSAPGNLTWAELLEREEDTQSLAELTLRTCARCRIRFSGDGELCQVCALRQRNPFGSTLPPGFTRRSRA